MTPLQFLETYFDADASNPQFCRILNRYAVDIGLGPHADEIREHVRTLPLEASIYGEGIELYVSGSKYILLDYPIYIAIPVEIVQDLPCWSGHWWRHTDE